MTRTDTSALLRDLRKWYLDHNEAMDFFACLISTIRHGESALSDECRTEIIDLLAQCFSAVEQDRIEQQEETLWEQNKQRRTT